MGAFYEHLPDEFDTEGAMFRLGGNEKLYRALFQMLLENHADSLEIISKNLGEGNSNDAAREAHSLKGIMGNLGHVSMSADLKCLQQAILNEEDVAGLLLSIENRFTELLRVVKQTLS